MRSRNFFPASFFFIFYSQSRFIKFCPGLTTFSYTCLLSYVLRKLPPVIKEFGKPFTQAGYQCFLVGGTIRNRMMGLEMTDFDFATDATPEDVKKLFRKVIPTGIQHGTVTVLFKGHSFEVTTFRIESNYSNLRHPDQVHFTPDIFEDLKRRDFTVNAMALNLATNELVDPHDGRGDIARKIIRAIGDPVERFNEDGLRLLRAVRFMSQLDFDIEKNTLEAMSACATNIKKVSNERVRDELIKILLSNSPSRAFFLMEETGLLPLILPELSRSRGTGQKGQHLFDVFEHSVYSADGASKHALEIPLAALLHDLGKTDTFKQGEDGIPVFHGHEQRSVELAHQILKRLKFPKALEEKVCHLIAHHMFNYEPAWTDAAVRRFLSRVNPRFIPDLFHLRRADSYGTNREHAGPEPLLSFQKRIEEVAAKDEALTIRDLKINGNDLFNVAGIPKGPVMGVILEFLLEAVLDDPSLNDSEKLLNLAVNFYENRLRPDGR